MSMHTSVSVYDHDSRTRNTIVWGLGLRAQLRGPGEDHVLDALPATATPQLIFWSRAVIWLGSQIVRIVIIAISSEEAEAAAEAVAVVLLSSAATAEVATMTTVIECTAIPSN